jgi:hypothetical protein
MNTDAIPINDALIYIQNNFPHQAEAARRATRNAQTVSDISFSGDAASFFFTDEKNDDYCLLVNQEVCRLYGASFRYME